MLKWKRCAWDVVTAYFKVLYHQYVEIKCQLDATDDFYCRSYCLLNMFQAPLCPSSGAREYYTSAATKYDRQQPLV